MANNEQWETIGSVISQQDSTVTVDEGSDGGWETLQMSDASQTSNVPTGGGVKLPQQPQSALDFLKGKATTGIANIGSAGTYSTAVGPGGAFATSPIEDVGMSTEQFQRDVLRVEPPRSQGQDALTRYVGTGLEAATDPLNFLLGTGSVPVKVLQGFSGGAGAEAGGDIGGGLDTLATGEESGIGRVLGNIVGSMAGAPIQGGGRYALEVGGDYLAQIKDKFSKVKADPTEVENMVAAGAAKNFLIEAAKAGGKDYNQLINDFRDVSQFVLGTDAPLLFQAADNPVFKEELIRLVKTDPSKNAALKAELNKVAEAIDRKSGVLFGQRYAPIPASAPMDIRNVRKRLDQIDNQISKLSDPFLVPSDKTDLGTAITNLVEAKRTLIKREMSPRYEALKEAARQEGVTVDPAATEALYMYVKQNKVLDIFGRQTDPEKKVSALLSPKQVEGVDILNAQRTTKQEFNSMSFDDIDSLKKLVNDQLRKVKDPVQEKKLMDFKNLLNDVRDQYVPPQYNEALKALDTEYYTRLGIPFGEQGIKDISVKKYASQVAPVILKNKQAYQDFIEVAGEQGQQLAKNAMINSAYEAVIKDGMVNNAALRTFMKKNEEVLKLMPDVQAMMANTRVADQRLRQTRATLEAQYEQAQKRIADNWFNGTQKEVPNMTQLVDSAFTNPQARAKLLRDVSDLSPEAAAAVRNTMRAEVVNKARNAPQGGIAFLTDPKNKQVLDVILGKGYQANLAKVLKLSDALKKADIEKLNLAVDLQKNLDPLNRLFPGLDIQSTVSTIRRPIVSPIQKGVILYSKISQARATKAFDKMIFDVLTDPTAVQKLAKTTDDLDLAFKNPMSFKDAMVSTVDSIPARVYIGLSAPDEAPQKVPERDIQFINQIMQQRGM